MIRHEPYIYIPKAALISYYPINGSSESLLVANVHGVNFTLNVETLAEQISATMDIIQHHEGPVIVAGDFNTWSQQRLEMLNKISASLGLKSVAFEGQQPATHMGKVVDHIYYRDLALLDSQVVAVNSSDHFPLKVRFALNQAGNNHD
jgi:endonuclease/exonuclease/phosphatase (EEP) superfamily protein YafD